MKIRTDFVTNSSSSSYICESCGRIASGWDYGLSDADMVDCENGHTICLDEMDELTFEIKKNFLLKNLEKEIIRQENGIKKEPDRFYYHERLEINQKDYDKLKNLTEEEVEKDYDLEEFISELEEDFDLRSNYPKELCPICKHDVITDYQMINYACEKLNISRSDLEKATRDFLIMKDNQDI